MRGAQTLGEHTATPDATPGNPNFKNAAEPPVISP